VLKSMAVRLPYPFAVFSPGNKHDEIIAMIESATPFVDQIILFVCPSLSGICCCAPARTAGPCH